MTNDPTPSIEQAGAVQPSDGGRRLNIPLVTRIAAMDAYIKSMARSLERLSAIDPPKAERLMDVIERMLVDLDDMQALAVAPQAAPAAPSTDAVQQAKDAARYRWLREQDWFDGPLCVLREPKRVLTRGIGLGADCPSGDRLDTAIDAAMAQGEGKPT